MSAKAPHLVNYSLLLSSTTRSSSYVGRRVPNYLEASRRQHIFPLQPQDLLRSRRIRLPVLPLEISPTSQRSHTIQHCSQVPRPHLRLSEQHIRPPQPHLCGTSIARPKENTRLLQPHTHLRQDLDQLWQLPERHRRARLAGEDLLDVGKRAVRADGEREGVVDAAEGEVEGGVVDVVDRHESQVVVEVAEREVLGRCSE